MAGVAVMLTGVVVGAADCADLAGIATPASVIAVGMALTLRVGLLPVPLDSVTAWVAVIVAGVATIVAL